MGRTRWRKNLGECARKLHREFRISFTPGVRPEKWVFVVGCYNSGTELLTSLLGAHPSISALPDEGQFLTDQLVCDFHLGLPRMWAMREDLFRLDEDAKGPDPERLQYEWLMRLDRSRPVFLEKSPPNSARTRWLQTHFKHAHFIAIVRNGYAVAEGIRRKADPPHLARGWPLELCGRQWVRSNEILLEDAKYLQNIHWIRYEDLTTEPEAHLDELLNFLELSDSDNIDFNKTWKVHERDEPIRNMNTESLRRLSDAEIETLTREMEGVLCKFGYEKL